MTTIDKNNNSNEIDVVPYTVKPSMESRIMYEKCLQYPKDCTFYFEGYDGVHNTDKLKKDLINAASKNGTF